MALTFAQAAWFMLAALPISLYVAYTDMKSLKIPNVAVYALVAGFAVLGLIALPFVDYLWRWTHLVVVLLIGMVANMVRLVGAGDAKFAAAAAPMIALPDLGLLAYVTAAAFVAAYLAHRIARHSPLRRLVPDWASWSSGKRFPMGLALGTALVGYLVLGLLQAAPALPGLT